MLVAFLSNNPYNFTLSAAFYGSERQPFGGFLPQNRCGGTPYCTAVASREKSAALSGISRASRIAIISIQRLAPVFTPAISAGILQNLQ